MKRNLLKLFVILLFAGFIFNCSQTGHKGFKKHKSGFLYKIHDKNADGKKAEIDNILTASMRYYTNDSVLFNSTDGDRPFIIPLRKPQFKGDIFEAISTMNVGDSTTFIMNIDTVFAKTFGAPKAPDFVDSADRDIYFDVKLLKVQTKEEQQAEREADILKKAEPNLKEGQSFLEENAKKDGVVTLPSGLQYKIIKKGRGKSPVAESEVKVHYTGTLIDGTVFDSSVQRGEPVDFPVGGVIPGWTEALKLMKKGSKWQLFIPADLAYGNNPRPGGPIKPGSTLLFDVELIDIVK